MIGLFWHVNYKKIFQKGICFRNRKKIIYKAVFEYFLQDSLWIFKLLEQVAVIPQKNLFSVVIPLEKSKEIVSNIYETITEI